MKKLVPRKPSVQAVTMRRRRGTVPTASPPLKNPESLDINPGDFPEGSGLTGGTGAAGDLSTATLADSFSPLPSEFGIHPSTGLERTQVPGSFDSPNNLASENECVLKLSAIV